MTQLNRMVNMLGPDLPVAENLHMHVCVRTPQHVKCRYMFTWRY